MLSFNGFCFISPWIYVGLIFIGCGRSEGDSDPTKSNEKSSQVHSFKMHVQQFYASKELLSLSQTFVENCGPCHGKRGEGRLNYPDIRAVSYSNFIYSVRSGRAGIMPAFSIDRYPSHVLDEDFQALTGKDIPDPNSDARPIDVSGDNPEISPILSYKTEKNGPLASGLGFGLNPFILPYVICKELLDPFGYEKTRRICANVAISGNTEENYRYNDFGVCRDIRTQRPYNFVPVKIRNGKTEEEAEIRLKNPVFAKELAWVTSQVRSSACVCCHDSSADLRTAYWDISKNRIWTDQLDAYAVEIFTGRVDSAALGAYKPEDNFGFNRYHTGLPTTDVPRMKAFFKGLADDLGTTEDEIKSMPPLADFLAKQLRENPPRCEKGVGVDSKTGLIKWKAKAFDSLPIGFVPGRFLYILEEDAQTPLVTPNLDKPKGTLWRIEVPNALEGFKSNKVRYGEVPKNAIQTIPDPQRFAILKPLIIGKTYRLLVQWDVSFPLTHCSFIYGEKA